jgi:predicted transcriptional regulator
VERGGSSGVPRKQTGNPTNAELAILSVLWAHGSCTVREVHERLEGDVGYTTALKFLQIMTRKGFVKRDDSNRAHVYTAACLKEEIQETLLRDLAARAFAGSASKLVMQALSSQRASAEELEEIRKLLDRMEDEPS